ncbi:MAG: Membrane protein insertase, YidC/Oxa1 family [Candidatus Roizmanbacteria bacterium GW2011_GWA2_36_23]|uniref:Membrane protein insertase, YidC/Oxa1 family n=1 Tax=Candidatus Roizmanbacteria bacterium GW2011_GWA2_36_23 TaxID=1618480 RepID=A0A0G0E3U0_9BACT|nr:MAG: Membrane protein insertase, YidC/Oxa1 family [Candidatus Roizmanbacteria bacterium GW2011_GWA2_36_23]
MLDPNLFNTLFVYPTLNILVFFYKIFLFLKIPGAFGLSILALTVFIRAILHPFFKQQIETAKKMQDLKPHLDRLSSKHKDDPKKIQQEQLRLYKEAGVNPGAGCLFMIIQLPVFIALYNTLSLLLSNGGAKLITQINKVLYTPYIHIQTIDPWFLGFNLALSPAKSGLWYYYSIPLITAFLQYLQVQVTTPSSPSKEKDKEIIVSSKDANDKKDSSNDFQKAMNTQMKFIFPIMIGWFSYTLPVGLSLYWNIFSLFSIMQYKKLKVKN